MLEETRGRKDKEIEELKETKEQLDNMEELDEKRKVVLLKKQFLEDDLEKEYH